MKQKQTMKIRNGSTITDGELNTAHSTMEKQLEGSNTIQQLDPVNIHRALTPPNSGRKQHSSGHENVFLDRPC